MTTLAPNPTYSSVTSQNTRPDNPYRYDRQSRSASKIRHIRITLRNLRRTPETTIQLSVKTASNNSTTRTTSNLSRKKPRRGC